MALYEASWLNSSPVQQFLQCLRGYFCIAQNLAQQATPDILPGMHRHGDNPAIRVSQPDMASPLPHNLKAKFLQKTDQPSCRQDRKLWH